PAVGGEGHALLGQPGALLSAARVGLGAAVGVDHPPPGDVLGAAGHGLANAAGTPADPEVGFGQLPVGGRLAGRDLAHQAPDGFGERAGHVLPASAPPRESSSAAALACSSGVITSAPMAWKPPSTWISSPVTPLDQSENSHRTVLATLVGSDRSQPSGARRCHTSANRLKPGMLRAAMVRIGPALTAFTRTLLAPRSRAR